MLIFLLSCAAIHSHRVMKINNMLLVSISDAGGRDRVHQVFLFLFEESRNGKH